MTTLQGPRWFPVLVCAAALAVYANALPNGFVWDDENLIVQNPLVKAWAQAPRLLTSPLQPNTLYYRPVQGLSFLVDYACFGLWPAGFHLTSMLVHALVGVLLYRFAARLLNDPLAGLCAALLFVVHPVHTEAVTYLSGRSDPLAAAFLLAALLWALEPRRLGLSLLAFLLAMLARESAVVLVPLIVLVDATVALRGGGAPPSTLARRVIVRALPYLAVAAAYLVLRHAVVGGGTVTHDTMDLPLGIRLLTMSTVVVEYLVLLVFPLALYMERVVPPATSVLDPAVLGASVVLVLMTVLAVVGRRRAWPFAFGWAWFGLALLPVANVFPLSTFMAEHWLYVPSMGLCIALGWALARGGARLGTRLGPSVVAAVLALLLVGYGARTMRRNLDWRDERTIYEATLRFAPDSARVHTNLGRIYWTAGERAAARQEFARAIALRPDDWQTADAHTFQGIMYTQDNRPQDALAEFERAVVLNPRSSALYVNLATVLQGLGRIDEARRALGHVLELDPRSAMAHSNLGNLDFNAGDLEQARRHYLTALALDPDLADAHNNLGSVYLMQGHPELAAPAFQRALQLDPNHPMARRNLAAAMGSVAPSAAR